MNRDDWPLEKKIAWSIQILVLFVTWLLFLPWFFEYPLGEPVRLLYSLVLCTGSFWVYAGYPGIKQMMPFYGLVLFSIGN